VTPYLANGLPAGFLEGFDGFLMLAKRAMGLNGEDGIADFEKGGWRRCRFRRRMSVGCGGGLGVITM
jgi:hypothetical protein